MTQEDLSARQERERKYYDQYSARAWANIEINFDPIRGKEERPWNSYWFHYAQVRGHFENPAQRLLDFGCGAGNAAVLYATVGYEFWGFDISPNNVALSIKNAERYKVNDRTHFKVGTAEKLEYEDNFFDVVAGMDVLHHVHIAEAIEECHRVLKPGGIAVFHEPVVAPVFDKIRRSSFGRWLVPNAASFDKHITEDERKLDGNDLAIIFKKFSRWQDNRFRLISRAAKLFASQDGFLGRLEQIDRSILTRATFLKRFAGTTVLVLEK